MAWLLAPLALLIERVIGYPAWLYKAIGHPVTWIGGLISSLDARLNTGANRRLKGIVALVLLVLTVLALGLLIIAITRRIPFGWVIEALLASTLLAQRELGRAVKAVADGLYLSLESGRRAVSHIVGRDPNALDEPGVARAAIESLAESTSDGVVSPLFWLLIGGLPGVLIYKAVNTADSMIGHKNAKYLDFGWASARLDDLANWPAARLSIAFIAAGAWLRKSRAAARAAVGTALRDSGLHRSPNSGWPEAAMAGALGIGLAGPRIYGGTRVDEPMMNASGRTVATIADIDLSLRIFSAACAALASVVLLVALLFAVL